MAERNSFSLFERTSLLVSIESLLVTTRTKSVLSENFLHIFALPMRRIKGESEWLIGSPQEIGQILFCDLGQERECSAN